MQDNPNNPPPQGFGVAFWNWVLINILFIKRRLNAISGSGGGGGGSQDLQSVTDFGNETTHVIETTVGGATTASIGNSQLCTFSGNTDPNGAATTGICVTTILDGTENTIQYYSPSGNLNLVADTSIIGSELLLPAKTDTIATLSDLTSFVTNPMSTDLNAGNFRITMVAAPVGMQDAANKAYVDTVAASLSWKTVVRVATAAALPAGTYNNGASGVGATFTVTATGTLTVDGVVTALNDRVLVKDQVSQLQNGIYTVTTAGAVGVQAVLTRSTDANTGTLLTSAAVATGSEGATNLNRAYIQVTPATITIGTSAIVWNLFLNTILSPGTGIRIAANIIYSRLSEGVSGGQSAIGGTGSEDTLTLQGSTSSTGRATTAPALILNSAGSLSASGTTQLFASVPFTVAQTGTAGYTGIKVAVTETTTGSGTKNLLDLCAGISGTSSKLAVANTGTTTWADGANFIVGSSAGTKIGTATTQKLAFFNSTPITQPSGDIATALSNLGLVSSPTLPSGSGGLIGLQVLTSGTTYTPTAGTTTAVIVGIGAGGGGGGAQGTSSQTGAAGGGGAGGMFVVKITGVTGTYTYSIGAGGIAGVGSGTLGSNTIGGTGGNTTFINGGTTYTAFGGVGGAIGASATTITARAGGAGGAISTNGDINSSGTYGTPGAGLIGSTGIGYAGSGGSTLYGSGGQGSVSVSATGANGTGYGAGGAGGFTTNATSRNGGVGANGIIVIYEYR